MLPASMLPAGHLDSASATLFSGAALLPTQSTQALSSSAAKPRAIQRVLPLTVKQIGDAYASSAGRSSLLVDGVDATNVRLLGIVTDKVERLTDATFTLDDGTGRIVVSRWVNEASDAAEMEGIQNGMYVVATCNLNGFQSKGLVFAFSVRGKILLTREWLFKHQIYQVDMCLLWLVTDFDYIALHFLECIYVHLENRRKVQGFHAKSLLDSTMSTPSPFGTKGYQGPLSNQLVSHSVTDSSRNDIYALVLDAFLDPAILARENGLHVNEVIRRVGLPKNKIMDAISYHVDVGNIYSTIDEYHFKSAGNG